MSFRCQWGNAPDEHTDHDREDDANDEADALVRIGKPHVVVYEIRERP